MQKRWREELRCLQPLCKHEMGDCTTQVMPTQNGSEACYVAWEAHYLMAFVAKQADEQPSFSNLEQRFSQLILCPNSAFCLDATNVPRAPLCHLVYTWNSTNTLCLKRFLPPVQLHLSSSPSAMLGCSAAHNHSDAPPLNSLLFVTCANYPSTQACFLMAAIASLCSTSRVAIIYPASLLFSAIFW